MMKSLKEYMHNQLSDSLSLDESTISTFYNDFFAGLTEQEKPQLYVLAGSPGSGKTTYRNKHLQSLENYYLHDMDEVLLRLPAYKDDLVSKGKLKAFDLWWKTARLIADMLVNFAFKRRLNIIYDRTCGAENSYFTIKQASDDSYDIRFLGFYVDEDKAITRVIKRAKFIARTVNPKQIHEYCARFSALWPYYIKFIDKIVLLDGNDVVDDIKIIYSHEFKNMIKDKTKYDAFLEIGKKLDFAKAFPRLNMDKS